MSKILERSKMSDSDGISIDKIKVEIAGADDDKLEKKS